MAYFTKEEIEQAKKIDIFTYLSNTRPDELVHESRNTYHTRTHDSLKINNGMWYWFSRGIGGKTALEYLIQVEEYSFTDAVGHLINQRGLEKRFAPRIEEKNKNDRLVLPDKAPNNDKVIQYLINGGIGYGIIDECINKGYIYQEKGKNNVVFVGCDENNNPRYAGVRGTNSSRYMHDAYGSDKTYSFKLESVVKNNSVHLFESAIDLLSYATLKEINKEKYDEENLLSLAGIYQPSKDIMSSKVPKTLSNFLKNNTNIDTIIIHFDNDDAGRLATKAVQNSLSASYKIIDDPPRSGKDFNDYLCDCLGLIIKKDNQYYR